LLRIAHGCLAVLCCCLTRLAGARGSTTARCAVRFAAVWTSREPATSRRSGENSSPLIWRATAPLLQLVVRFVGADRAALVRPSRCAALRARPTPSGSTSGESKAWLLVRIPALARCEAMRVSLLVAGRERDDSYVLEADLPGTLVPPASARHIESTLQPCFDFDADSCCSLCCFRLAGVLKEDVNIDIDQDTLTIRAGGCCSAVWLLRVIWFASAGSFRLRSSELVCAVLVLCAVADVRRSQVPAAQRALGRSVPSTHRPALWLIIFVDCCFVQSGAATSATTAASSACCGCVRFAAFLCLRPVLLPRQ
jgi:hypothetical protein